MRNFHKLVFYKIWINGFAKNMNSIKVIVIFLYLFTSVVWADNSKIKLYAIDCGSIDVSDMKDLSSTGEYDGQKVHLVNPCFLIQHPRGNLLWDTGHIDSLADNPNGEISGVWHSKLSNTLIKQLHQLDLSVKDINYISLSHAHPDHSGNANKFIDSTFIVNALEHEYMFSEPAKTYFGTYYSELKNAKNILFSSEHDVFGDGSVVIKSMPGHTPGSSVLLIRLYNEGNVLLTGDLYIHARERQTGTMHKFNVDKESTVISRAKFESLVKRENARVVIQHDKQDFDLLPKFPKFLN
jgi:N-acyl homoserine lactone hydrolase